MVEIGKTTRMDHKQDYAKVLAGAMGAQRNDPQAIRMRVEALEKLLEGSIVVPGINRRVGLDAIIGLVPGIGDLISAALGSYMVWEARNLGMPKWQLLRMSAHVGFDTLLGAVPVAGDAFDFFYRSNTRNLRIIRKHLDKHHPDTNPIIDIAKR